MEQKKRKRIYNNVFSDYLTDQEKYTLADIMGPKRVFTISAIAKLLLTSPPAHNVWNELGYGVICFVRDSNRKSCYIQFVDMDKKKMVWEEEVYSPFSLDILSNNFVTFETKFCVAGLSFPYEDEASKFYNKINRMIKSYVKKTSEPATRDETPVIHLEPIETDSLKKKKQQPQQSQQHQSSGNKASWGFLTFKKRNKRYTVSEPSGFIHVNKDGELSKLKREDIPNDKWRLLEELLQLSQPANEVQTEKIIGSIVVAGGVDEMINLLQKLKNTKTSTETIEAVKGKGVKSTSENEQRLPPPPPKSSSKPPPPQPELPRGSGSRATPPPPPAPAMRGNKNDAPPPPPPPPPSGVSQNCRANAPPPPPPPSTSQRSSAASLKQANSDESLSSGSSERSGLLAAIRHGTTLKKIGGEEKVSQTPTNKSSEEEIGDLAGLLSNALGLLRTNIESDSDEDSDNSFGNDDFDNDSD